MVEGSLVLQKVALGLVQSGLEGWGTVGAGSVESGFGVGIGQFGVLIRMCSILRFAHIDDG